MKFFTTLVIIITILSCCLPKHELDSLLVDNQFTISKAIDVSHQHANDQCADFGSNFCHSSHCIYLYEKNIFVLPIDFPYIYTSYDISRYHFNFTSSLLRPPIV